MTNGTIVKDELGGWAPCYFDGSPQGNGPYGKYFSRTWSGIDSTPLTRTARNYERRFYSTLDAKGRVRKRSYRVYLTDKPRKWKSEPHYYSATFREYLASPYYDLTRGIIGLWSRNETGTLLTGGAWPPGALWRPTAPDFDANSQIKLIGRLKEKIRGSEFNLAVSLAELPEALRMIGDSAIRVARAYTYARKGNFVAAVQSMSRSAQAARKNMTLLPKRLNVTNLRRQSADQLSSNWLELQYGWLPLLGDIQSGAEFVAHHLNVPRKKRYTASVRVRNRDPAAGRYFVGAEHYAYTSRRIVAYISEVPESIPRLTGLMDPELVLWEKIPFSFVADWVAPIGDYLEARAFSKSLTGVFIETTFKVENASGGLVGNTFEYSPGHLAFGVVNQGGDLVDRYVSIERTVSTTLSVPRPKIKPLNKILSFKHCLNGLALLSAVTKTPIRDPKSP